MTPSLKYFLEAVKKATNVDDDTLEAVKEIHETIYNDEDDSDENDTSIEEAEDVIEDAIENVADGEVDVNVEIDNDSSSEADGEVTLLHNVLANLLEKRNAYETFHWNTDIDSLHLLSEDAYDLYQETADAIAETIRGNYDMDINANVWHDVPTIESTADFIDNIKEDYEHFCQLREQLDDYNLYGVNSLLDGFIEKLTTIKYKAVSFYNGDDDD